MATCSLQILSYRLQGMTSPNPLHNKPLIEQIRHRNLEARWQKTVAVDKGCVPRALSFLFNCSFVLAARACQWVPEQGATTSGVIQGMCELSRLVGAKVEVLDLSERPTLGTLRLDKRDRGVILFWEPYKGFGQGVGHLCAFDQGRVYGVKKMMKDAPVHWQCRVIPTSVEADQGKIFLKGEKLVGPKSLTDVGAIDWTQDKERVVIEG